MTSETEVRALSQAHVDAWPPDDTEESVVGTDLHQETITNLRLGITEAAQLCREEGTSPPWKVLSQTMLLGCLRPDGSAYRTLPDIFVYRHPVDRTRPSVALTTDGPPVLILEVLSASTYDSDLDIERGKGFSYAKAGVREYLALDPTATMVPEGGRGWRLAEGGYRPWNRDADDRWSSEEIGVAFGFEGIMATVYTVEGRRIFRAGEVETEIDELRRRLRAATGE